MFNSKRLVLSILIIVSLGSGVFYGLHHLFTESHRQASVATKSKPSVTKSAVSPQPLAGTFDKKAYSTNDSKSLWVVVNKHRPLNPLSYVPDNLVIPDIPLRSNITGEEKYVRADNAKALKVMIDVAAKEGIHFNLQSGYRSYKFQVNLYNSYVKQQGKVLADSQSARAGFSEHQTGLAADLGGTTNPGCNVEECFANTKEGKWLAANAYIYGYIVRYPEGKTAVTGYTYEPWHVRYVGIDLAAEMHKDHVTTLEEFFGLESAPDYK